MYSLLFMLGGAIIGIVLEFAIQAINTQGVIRIDRHSSEKDIYRLELDELDNLHKRKKVVLKVDPNADLSQN